MSKSFFRVALISASLFALAAAAPIPANAGAYEDALRAAGKSQAPSQTSQRAVNNQTAVACNMCFTCGGDWPVFAGSWTSSSGFATERGSSCSGSLASRVDSSPLLCCR